MALLPPDVLPLISVFAPLFTDRVWRRAQVLLIGAILTPGTRTVTAVLRIMGLAQERCFKHYQRVLSRSRWSGLAASRLLLTLLVGILVPPGPVVMGLDATIERRWGRKIAARGSYRAPARSSHGPVVNASGLRGLSLMLLVPIPWAGRGWALPLLTALCPSARYYQRHGRQHQSLTERARQLLRLAHRWWPAGALVVVADSSFAALALLAAVSGETLSVVTRLRLDAARDEPAPERVAGRKGRPRKTGRRLATLSARAAAPATRWQRLAVAWWYGAVNRTIESAAATAVWFHTGMPPVAARWVLIRDPQTRFKTQARLCTNLNTEATMIVHWVVPRWRLEVTVEEARAHLGVETQRQWSKRALARATPLLLALFSVVTLIAHQLVATQSRPVRTSAWYHKRQPRFRDALAWARRHLWTGASFSTSRAKSEGKKIPELPLARLIEVLGSAA